MSEKFLNFIEQNSPDGGFLQSEYWRKFQEAVGKKTYSLSQSGEDGKIVAFANIIEHKLPIVGKYFYLPRGPVISEQQSVISEQYIKEFLRDLLNLAKGSSIGWIRIEPNNDKELKLIKDNLPKNFKMRKSAVDMQPKEILMVDISRSEEELLAQMKQKTRYNIRLAEKRGVKVFDSREKIYIDEFCRLVDITARRDKIKSHPQSYYRSMFETIPPQIFRLYIAEYEGKIIAANLVLFFGQTATYMHGASDDDHRNSMAPYFLQWQAIQDAKKIGCEKYDFGGVKLEKSGGKSWEGITKFKTGFASGGFPVRFPGCYDIIIKPAKYNLYRVLQKAKRFL